MGFFRIAALLCFSAVMMHAQQTDILFIGNSYTAYNGGVYQHLENLAAAAEPSIAVNESHIIAGGQNLKSHWENSDTYGGINAIRNGDNDIVVLQGYFRSNSAIEDFCTYARKFDELIDSVGAQTVFYMNWTNPFDPYADLSNQRLGEVYDSMAAELDAEVVHVGMAIEALSQTTPDSLLYSDATAHPYPMGTYLATCCFYSRLFGKTPAGISYNSDPTTISDSLMLVLQELGWTTEETDDTTAPGVSRVAAEDSVTVSIRFNEAVNVTDAGTAGNYTVAGLSVTAAVAQSDNRTVFLTVSPMTDGQQYTVSVTGIRDLADPVNTAASIQKTFTYWNAGAKNIDDVAIHLPFDGGLADMSWNSFTASWGNGESFSSGYVGQGIRPLAGSTYVTVALPGVVSLTDIPMVSICAWGKKDADDWGGLIMNRHAIYSIEATATGIQGRITNADAITKYASGTANTADTLWHHYALTYDGETLYVYVDGVKAGQAAQSGLLRDDKNRDIWIGWNPFGTDKFFNGTVDEVRVYDWALTDDHVRQIYELNTPSAPVVEIPYFTPESGAFTDSVLVGINCTTDSVTIRYTTDGSVPTVSSDEYTTELLLTETTTLSAKAFRDGYTASEAALAVFTVTTGSTSVIQLPGTMASPASVLSWSGNGVCKIYTPSAARIRVLDMSGNAAPALMLAAGKGYRIIRIDGSTGMYVISIADGSTTVHHQYLLLK